MPDNISKKDAAKLSERQRRIYEFLRSNRAGVLATVDSNGEPHGTVIYHMLDEHFTVSFLTKAGTKKYDNLIRNNHVALVVFDPKSQTVVQVVGEATETTNANEINAVAADIFTASIKTSVGGVPPIAKLQAGEFTAFKIQPKQIRMAAYARSDAGDYNDIFDTVESFELIDDNS